MKDSKNKLKKSSSESKILETKTFPPMPKDKRTKEYKEWYKKYGEIDSYWNFFSGELGDLKWSGVI